MTTASENNKLHILRRHFENHGHIWFLALFWVFYSLMILDSSYVGSIEFSYDSSSYFRAADAIRHGHGFHDDALAGGSGWFYWWPIGYPALIAAVASVFRGVSIYLCSKILSILVVGLLLLFFGRVFKKNAWLCALLLLNTGVVAVYRISLSETVFVPLFILFAYLLSEVVTRPEPPLRHYVFLYLCMTGLFLLRYFGVVATMFAGCVWLVQLVKTVRQRENTALRKKTLLFAASGIAAALSEGAYLLMNARMTGFVPGVSTQGQMTKLWELKAQVYASLQEELTNLLSIRESPLFDTYTIKAQRILMAAILTALIYLLIRRKKADRSAMFILTGLFYDFVLLVTLFLTQTDTSGSRFLFPATTLILIGLISVATEQTERKWLNSLQYVAGFLLLLGIFSISYGWSHDGIEPTAYDEMQQEITQEYRDVAPRSVILEHELSYRAPFRYFRPDVVFDGHIEASDTVDSVLKRYEMYDHIYISKPAIRGLLYATDRSISDDMRTHLRSLLEQADSSGKYLLFTSPAS
ncbi:MAG: glycosyltransferase family 39 protein [Lachnospiraceae bacterium]|nr:glycosyltransferase family 39 protein [Lachnospiraceae bacterium]